MGVDINVENIYGGWSNIHYASMNGKFDIVKYLVENGVCVDKKTNRETPLMIASIHRHLNVVQYLVENGADVNQVDSHGRISLNYFGELKNESQQNEQIQIIEYLVSKGENLYHVDNDGSTFLYDTIYDRNLLLVQYAIQHGVNKNQPISKTHTPLTLSISKHLRITKYLIENGADVMICDQNRNMNKWTVDELAQI